MDIGTSTSESAGSETEGSEEKEGSEEAEGSGDSMSISASSIADGNKALKWFGSSSTQMGRSLLVRSMTALRIESCRCAAKLGTYAISNGRKLSCVDGHYGPREPVGKAVHVCLVHE